KTLQQTRIFYYLYVMQKLRVGGFIKPQLLGIILSKLHIMLLKSRESCIKKTSSTGENVFFAVPY
ncbi:hypothetical protein, partial [Bacillus pseudomycoides]|uniref:hypothetical protein n=1 Tax=Bacillus pseudomycoides TaxID=64104 RepID=UPI000BEC44D0